MLCTDHILLWPPLWAQVWPSLRQHLWKHALHCIGAEQSHTQFADNMRQSTWPPMQWICTHCHCAHQLQRAKMQRLHLMSMPAEPLNSLLPFIHRYGLKVSGSFQCFGFRCKRWIRKNGLVPLGMLQPATVSPFALDRTIIPSGGHMCRVSSKKAAKQSTVSTSSNVIVSNFGAFALCMMFLRTDLCMSGCLDRTNGPQPPGGSRFLTIQQKCLEFVFQFLIIQGVLSVGLTSLQKQLQDGLRSGCQLLLVGVRIETLGAAQAKCCPLSTRERHGFFGSRDSNMDPVISGLW